ncbi:helix-turn-helix domain-containing protein [Thermococcus sp.]|uniref:helix-turn-helix transcriptional regulator n=1 Tax=Thermococcus sp. TaxID=35749 RepID=UPI002611295A|nr:helix-turn-helix domain-containing protein [Thermococcus sp.]MCD6143670.1 helix-turn-helix domain-containing protein [Thermococcus sp.]MCD6143681.1 helix-turn-helix domain-containing protein [Thermococcus sp.]
MKEILTRKEIMELFGISLSTVIRWEKQGILKPIKLSPRKIVYKKEDIERLLEERRIEKQ